MNMLPAVPNAGSGQLDRPAKPELPLRAAICLWVGASAVLWLVVVAATVSIA
jgi:hypothetical protein